MGSGISITGLTIGGAALTAIGGMIGAWIRARHGRTEIVPRPLDVRQVDGGITIDACREHRSGIITAQSNIFSRISICEQRIAAVEEGLRGLGAIVARMDAKLDTILGRLPQ